MQAFDQLSFIKYFQMHLLVEEVDGWHSAVVNAGIAKQLRIRVDALQDQSWSMREVVLFDHSGVLRRVVQNTPAAKAA